MVFKETKIKNIKITDAKLCGECSTIQTSNFIHLTSDISVAAVPVPSVLMASTMSVDEYFDALIDQVREDYASL